MGYDLIDALSNGDIRNVKKIYGNLNRKINELISNIDPYDNFYEEDLAAINEIKDKLKFKNNFKSALEGYRKTGKVSLIWFCVVNLTDIDVEYSLTEVIYENLYEVLISLLDNVLTKQLTNKGILNNVLSSACEMKNLYIIYELLLRNAVNDYVVEYYIGIEEPEYIKLRDIIYKLIVNKSLIPWIRIILKSKNILIFKLIIHNIQYDFTAKEIEVFLRYFMDKRTIHNKDMFNLIKQLYNVGSTRSPLTLSGVSPLRD